MGVPPPPTGMSTGTSALQTTYPGQKRADKRTFNTRVLLTKKDRNRPMKMTDFARVFQPIPLRFNYPLISTIQYLQRLFIHKKITPARLACLCFTSRKSSVFRTRRQVSCEMFIVKSVSKTLSKKLYLRLYLTQIVHSNSKMLFL